MSLPPLAPPLAAAPRLQPRKQRQSPPPPVAAPRKPAAAGAPFSPGQPPRKGRGAPLERAGRFSSSWPSASLPKQGPRGRQTPAADPPGPAADPPGPSQAQPFPRGRPSWRPPGSGARSCQSLCGAPPGGRGEAAGAALRFSLSLPPEAIRVLQRRSLERQHHQPPPPPRCPRGRAPGSAAPVALQRPLASGGSAGGGDWRAWLQVSLLNERHRYDDEEYEEEQQEAEEGLVRKCTEWLRGVESAAAAPAPDRAEKLDSLPHLSTL